MMIRVACVSDVHSPKYLDLFKNSLRKIRGEKVDLFLFAGDMIYKGQIDELNRIFTILEENEIKFPIYACFGNEEYDQLYEKLRELGKNKIIYLEDEATCVQIKEYTIEIIGTKGSLAEPTWWQKQNIPNIKNFYQERIKKIEALLAQTKKNVNIRILLFHYAPTYLTVVGEQKRAYPQMGTKAFEKTIVKPKYKIDAVFHGHAHRGTKFTLLKNRVPIYNTALPLRKSITIIELPKPRQGILLNFLK